MNLKLTDSPQAPSSGRTPAAARATSTSGLAETLQRNLDARPSRASGVIVISHRSPDPKFAAGSQPTPSRRPTCRWRWNCAWTRRASTAAFFDTRVKSARKLEQAQAKASAYQRENNIISIDERFDIETARLNELSSQLVALQTMSSEGAIRQNQAQTSSDRVREVLSNPVIRQPEGRPGPAEARASRSWSARFGDAHPQMREAQASIAEIQVPHRHRDAAHRRRRGREQPDQQTARNRPAGLAGRAARQGAQAQGHARRERAAASARWSHQSRQYEGAGGAFQ